MKKLMITITCLLFFGLSNVNAQTINGLPIEDIDVDYIEFGYLITKRKIINIDLGPSLNEKIYTDEYKKKIGHDIIIIKGKDGKVKEFQTRVHLINFFSEQGFKVVTAYGINEVAIFILERRRKGKGK